MMPELTGKSARIRQFRDHSWAVSEPAVRNMSLGFNREAIP
jgi:hypothetical protein